jgi:hypothetical protein
MSRARPAVLLATGLGFVVLDVGLLLGYGRTGTMYGIRFGVGLYVLQVVLVAAFPAGGYAAARLWPGNATGVLMLWLGVVVALNSSAGFLPVTEAWPVVANVRWDVISDTDMDRRRYVSHVRPDAASFVRGRA